MRKTQSPFVATLVFTILNFLQPAINVFLLPLYLKYLPPEEYGIYTLMNNLSTLVVIVGGLRISAAMVTYYYDFRYNQHRLHTYLGNIIGVSILLSLAFLVLSIIGGPPAFRLLFKDEELLFFPYGILATGIGLLYVIMSPYFIFLKNEKQIFKYALVHILLVISTVVLQVWLIIFMQLEAKGALIAKLAANGIGALIVLYLSRKVLTFRFKRYYIYRSLAFSLPLLPFLIINWVSVFGDRFILERYLDLTTVGIYGLLMTLAGMIMMALDAVINGIRPFLFDYFSEGTELNRRRIDELFQFYFAACMIAISGIMLVGTNIRLITQNEDYLRIIPYLTIASFIFFLRAYIFLFNQNLMYNKNSKEISILSIGLVTVLLAGYFLLIPRLGITGALLANILSNVLLALAFWKVAQRKFPVPLQWQTVVLLPSTLMIIIIGFEFSVRTGYLNYPLMGLIQFLTVSLILLVVHFRKIQTLVSSSSRDRR